MMKRILFFILLCLVIGAAALLWHSYERTNSQEPQFLRLYGNIDIRQVDIGFRINGRVTSMLFEEGDIVPVGALMAALDPYPYIDQTQQAAAATAAARVSLDNAMQLLKRREELLHGGGISIEDYENTLSSKEILTAQLQESQASWDVAKTNLNDTQVFAPTTGTILTRVREPGSVIKVGDAVYTLSITAPVWVRAYVTEPQLGLIAPGMTVEISTDTPGSPIYHGTIGFISPVAEFTPKTVETTQLRTDLVYRLRITADNPDQGLRQGMPVTITIPLGQRHASEPS